MTNFLSEFYEVISFPLLIKKVEDIYLNCAAEDEDLYGYSVLDLAADQLPTETLKRLRKAIVASDIIHIANQRIKTQIIGYSVWDKD